MAQDKHPMENTKQEPAPGTQAFFYAELAKEIIAALEKNTVPWVRPWTWSPCVVVVGANEIEDTGWARNIAGPALPFGPLNGVILQVAANTRGYRTNFWVDDMRIQKLGVVPKDGESPCVVAQFFPNQDVSEPLGTRELYNLDQIEDLASLGVNIRDLRRPLGDFKFSYTRAKSGLKDLNLNLDVGWRKEAAYLPNEDRIEMPKVWQFIEKVKTGDRKREGEAHYWEGEAHYWATLWHEVVHWTGHPSRLARFSLNHRRGGDSYAREELVAEFGAAFLCSHFGIRGNLQYESYIASWLRGLKDNPEEVLQESVKQAIAAWELVRDTIKNARRRDRSSESVLVHDEINF